MQPGNHIFFLETINLELNNLELIFLGKLRIILLRNDKLEEDITRDTPQ